MAEGSLIAWTHNTFNPWIGCVKVSDGCKNCYAETLVENRLGPALGRTDLWGPATAGKHRMATSDGYWRKPLAWNRAAMKSGIATRVFCASLADVFEQHPDLDAVRPKLWELIRSTPLLWWQLLTKRPENMHRMLPDDWGAGYPNVWLGTSVENMKVAHRTRALIEVPAVVHFISYEPALGPLDDLDLRGLDWVIYGGESGAHYRKDERAWPRAMRAKCAKAGVAFFDKQRSGPRTEMGPALAGDGPITRQYPVPRSTYDARYRLADPAREAYRRRVARDQAEHAQRMAQ
ncbi:MAG TPA: DUF5131 family protein [Gemmatimonadaceae bacterium]|jgi:protein gp37